MDVISQSVRKHSRLGADDSQFRAPNIATKGTTSDLILNTIFEAWAEKRNGGVYAITSFCKEAYNHCVNGMQAQTKTT